MRKIFVALALFMLSMSVAAQVGWVYLNNGTIVKGDVTVNEGVVSIMADNGSVYSYPMAEINKISYEKEPVLPAVNQDKLLDDYGTYSRGFWFRASASAAYTLFLSNRCTPFAEVDITGGYRFCQYLKAGVGVGLRYYIDNDKLRSRNHEMSFPVYANLSGNIIDEAYRTVVPYYSMDCGGTIRDGFMWRPSLGIRVGQSRSAFLLAVTYTGQILRYKTAENRYVSALGLTLGYEF